MRSRSSKHCIDIVGMDDKEHFILRNGELMEIIKIRSKDLNSLSDDENYYLILKWAKIYKLHAPDIKIICMNYPCNTSIQQEFITKKMQDTNNEIYRETLNTYLKELRWLQENDTTRNFYLLIFASSDEELDNSIRRWKENLGVNKNGLLKELQFGEKIEIWHNLINKGILFK